jgi:two-component system, chemotaxis family, chemotaxis protein CheY
MESKKTIMVVEDFASIRNFICQTLHRKGYSTIAASNVNSACELISANHAGVSLVITDYNMPDGTGFDLLNRLKENSKTIHIPVIFLTTESNPDLIKRAKTAGLAGWIKKPYRADAFFDQIARVINT